MAFPMIPHSRPSLGPEEEAAAARVVRSGQLAQGPEVWEAQEARYSAWLTADAEPELLGLLAERLS